MSEKEENQDMQEQVSDVPTNIIYYADCLVAMEKIPDKSVDAIYLDPPFSKKQNKIYGIIPKTLQEEDIHGGIFEGGDKVYVFTWLAARLRKCRDLLKPTGSIFLHLDDSLVFEAKIMMDGIFGKRNFLNAIVWCYRLPANAKHNFPQKHDTILFYAKDSTQAVFNPQRVPYAPDRGLDSRGGRVRDLSRGKIVEDFWTDIKPSVQCGSNEERKNRYPTEKPKELLERIIKCATNEGDVVLDPFAGSGTTGIVAEKFGRKWIMIDASDEAQHRMKKRFENIAYTYESLPLGRTETNDRMTEIENDPIIAEKEVCKRLGFQHTGKSGDEGMDGISVKGDVGLQVKKWQSKVRAPDIRAFVGDLFMKGLKKGIYVATEFGDSAKGVQMEAKARGVIVELETFKHLGLAFYNVGAGS